MTPVAAGDSILGQSKKLICLDAADKLTTLWMERTKTFKPDCHLIVGMLGLAFNQQGEMVPFSFDRPRA